HGVRPTPAGGDAGSCLQGGPGESNARVVATGTSQTTGRVFNRAGAFDRARDVDGNLLGRGIAESSFHHFADYNWDTDRGAPCFVTEPSGDGIKREPRALDHIKAYVRNLAGCLALSRDPVRPF